VNEEEGQQVQAAAAKATIGMAPSAAAGHQKLWPWQKMDGIKQRLRRGEESEAAADDAEKRERKEEAEDFTGRVGGERRRLLATDPALLSNPSLTASTFYYNRSRQPIWSNHSDIADDLHPTIIGAISMEKGAGVDGPPVCPSSVMHAGMLPCTRHSCQSNGVNRFLSQ
jgi:hypothetical protein